MSFRLEYTERHLTPRGWERGTERIDYGKVTQKDPPPDRVLSVRWTEEQPSPYAKIHRGSEKFWRSKDEAVLQRLLAVARAVDWTVN
jgi:hypothetical protein